MSVVGVALVMDRPKGNFELGSYEIRVPYRVVVNDAGDGPEVAASAPGLPLLFSTYLYGNESNTLMRARRYEAEPVGSPPTMVWRVWVVYKTPDRKEHTRVPSTAGQGTGRETAGEFTNPLLETPTVKFHSSGREALLTRIYDNVTGSFKPCTASNGEVFDPPPKYLEPFATLEITRNEAIGANQPSVALTYANAVNSDLFWGFGAGYWKIKDIVPERQDRQVPSSPFNFPFLRVSYSFEFNPLTWDLQILDYGSYTWTREAGDPQGLGQQIVATRTPIKTRDGHPTNAPLNGFGRILPDRSPYTASVQATPDINNTIIKINPIQPAPQGQFNTGDLVLLSSIPLDGAVAIAAPAGLSYNTTYFVRDLTTAMDGTQTFNLASSVGGAAIATTDTGTGWQYVYSPGVFFTIRPYARLAFSALGLPQSFALCQ